MWLVFYMGIIIIPLVLFGIYLLWRDYRTGRDGEKTVHAG
jgi:hypothetical protein